MTNFQIEKQANRPHLVGAIEAGGTKFVCAIGSADGNIVQKVTIPTESPEKTLPAALAFFNQHRGDFPIESLGLGCFGPVALDPTSTNWGHILTTPKQGWSGTAVAPFFQRALDIPVAFDTDVNCALLGEVAFGAGRGIKDLVYVTVGTGIGGGILANGKVVHGAMHSEFGHMLVGRELDDPSHFSGTCRFHGGNCLEGLASGPAIARRWGAPAQDLPEGHPAWTLQAKYLATLCANLSLVTAPERIIFGGGVMQQTHLFPLIPKYLASKLGDYMPHACGKGFILPAALGQEAGIKGALLLAQR